VSSEAVGHGSKLARKKEAAIEALLTQRNLEEAARVAGIGKETLRRWLKLEEFRMAYREARREVFSQSNARLQQACGAAVSTLFKVMVDANSPPAARVRAAEGILRGAKQAIEFEDIEARLTALERQAKTSSVDGQ
jgi:hypothetical protein